MARYYYDKYGVNSSTTYTWSKYNTVSTTDYAWSKYEVGIHYYLGPWSSKEVAESGATKKIGRTSFSVKQTGVIGMTGTTKTIYATDGTGDVVYTFSGSMDTVHRHYFSTEGILYRQTAHLLSEDGQGSFISSRRGSYNYKFHNQVNSDGYWWVRGSSSTTYSRGSYVSQISGKSYNYKLNDQRNSDGYWWVRGSSSTVYSRGSFIDTIIAEDGTYPTNGRVGTSYWYVRGSILTHTVTFKDWNGTTLKTQTVNDGSSASPPTNPSRTGYTFSGWSGTYTNVTANRTITATYTIKSYTVTFKDWDGTTLKTQSVNYGSSATPPSDPSRSGYSFDGWSGTYTNVTSSRTITATYSYIPVPPSTPSSITVPTDVKGGYDLYISWGSSTGASKYYLYRNIDSGGYVSIYSGISRNYTDTIPKGASTVSYRVRAYNSDGYSSYRTSSERSVRNFPEMKFKIDGSITTSESGWVKVNGVLRPIEQIWVKVNGSLKEVQ